MSARAFHHFVSVPLVAAALCGCGGPSDQVVVPTNVEPVPKDGSQSFQAQPYVPLNSESEPAPGN